MEMKDDRYLLFEVNETYINSAIYEQEKVKSLDKTHINFLYYPNADRKSVV